MKRDIPTPLESVNQATLTEYGPMVMCILQGQLILQLNLPLVTENGYQMYELVPVPVFDQIELPLNTAMEIIPAGRYIAIVTKNNEHFFLKEEQWRACTKVGRISVCRAEHQTTVKSDCESRLISDPESYRARSLCKRHLVIGPDYYLIKTTNPSKRIFCTSRRIYSTALCKDEESV